MKVSVLVGCNFSKKTREKPGLFGRVYIYIYIYKHVNENMYVFFEKGSLGSYVFRLKTVLKAYQSKFCAYVLLL